MHILLPELSIVDAVVTRTITAPAPTIPVTKLVKYVVKNALFKRPKWRRDIINWLRLQKNSD